MNRSAEVSVLFNSLSWLVAPWIDHFDPAILVVARVSGGYGGFVGAGNSGDLAVELADRLPRGLAGGGNSGIGSCGGAVEGKNAATEILLQDALDGLCESGAPPSHREDSNAEVQFCLAHRCEVDGRAILGGKPRLHGRCRRWTQEFGDDIGVEHYHSRMRRK